MQENQHHEEHHLVPYSVYLWVWAALICFTGITVGAHFMNLQHLAIFAALLIATVKAVLVVLYFMHLRYEKPIFAVMIGVTLATYATFIALTFTDYPFR